MNFGKAFEEVKKRKSNEIAAMEQGCSDKSTIS